MPPKPPVPKKLYAMGYYGSKLRHLDQILPLLPVTGVQTYVEPFGGSAAVLFNRAQSPVEIYNDLDHDIVTFFRVLRDQPQRLINALMLTPYSREEFAQACERDLDRDDFERARAFLVRIGQGRNAMPRSTAGQFSYSVVESRLGMSSATSAWMSMVAKLDQVVARLRVVTIECLPALEIIERYDTPDTLFYVDPPYVTSTRNADACYIYEMDDAAHEALAAALLKAQGRVAVSGYFSSLYDFLYRDWTMRKLPKKYITSSADNGPGAERQEVVWMNYDPDDVHSVNSLPLYGQ